MKSESVSTPHHVRVRKFGRLSHAKKKKGRARVIRPRHARFKAFGLPEQHLFPPYYDAERPWVVRPDMASRIVGGKTVQGGSRYASHIVSGKTVKGGSRYASRISGGKTVQGGSRYASRIKGGKTVEQGSRWRSRMPNWRFSGYAAPVRPRGIPYFRAPW